MHDDGFDKELHVIRILICEAPKEKWIQELYFFSLNSVLTLEKISHQTINTINAVAGKPGEMAKRKLTHAYIIMTDKVTIEHGVSETTEEKVVAFLAARNIPIQQVTDSEDLRIIFDNDLAFLLLGSQPAFKKTIDETPSLVAVHDQTPSIVQHARALLHHQSRIRCLIEQLLRRQLMVDQQLGTIK